MVDKALNSILEGIVRSNEATAKPQDKEKQKVSKLEEKLRSLLQNKAQIDPSQIAKLISEAQTLDKVADLANNIADQLEKNKKKEEAKKKEEVTKAQLEKLGIPAEFVQQLSILTKAGPDALREASHVYRTEAKNKRQQADFMNLNIEKIDKEIKEINSIKSSITSEKSSNQISMKDFIAKIRYQESLREKADLVLKEMLESMEGGSGFGH